MCNEVCIILFYCIVYNYNTHFFRNNEMVQDEPSKLVGPNKKNKTNNMLNSLCKTVYENKKINHGDNVLESPTSAHKYL